MCVWTLCKYEAISVLLGFCPNTCIDLVYVSSALPIPSTLCMLSVPSPQEIYRTAKHSADIPIHFTDDIRTQSTTPERKICLCSG